MQLNLFEDTKVKDCAASGSVNLQDDELASIIAYMDSEGNLTKYKRSLFQAAQSLLAYAEDLFGSAPATNTQRVRTGKSRDIDVSEEEEEDPLDTF